LWISRARSLPFGDATGHGAGLGMTTLRPAQMQWVVVPNERSDREASPEGARDLGFDFALSSRTSAARLYLPVVLRLMPHFFVVLSNAKDLAFALALSS
jgi:hypothetical protein